MKSEIMPRRALIAELATLRVSDIDTSTLIEMSLDSRESLDATIERVERIERSRLRKIPTQKLWEMLDEHG